jgi:hypothetical protein
MYIVAIAWLYVALMVSILQPSAVAGVITFVGAGLFPLAILLYLLGTPQRRRNLAREQAEHERAPDPAGAPQPSDPAQPAQPQQPPGSR